MKTELLVMGHGKTPVRAFPTDSGVDVFANEGIYIRPGITQVISTGIACQVNVIWEYGEKEERYEYNKTWTLGVFVHERSGLASKGLRLGGGVIDNSYVREVGIIATHADGYMITEGMKIAQLIVTRVELPTIRRVDRFDIIDERGAGFGSTGNV